MKVGDILSRIHTTRYKDIKDTPEGFEERYEARELPQTKNTPRLPSLKNRSFNDLAERVGIDVER